MLAAMTDTKLEELEDESRSLELLGWIGVAASKTCVQKNVILLEFIFVFDLIKRLFVVLNSLSFSEIPQNLVNLNVP